MRFAVLALVIAGTATRAHALRVDFRESWDCSCRDHEHVRPHIGESGVPTNARLWRLPALDSPDEQLSLDANTSYDFPGTTFTTDAVPDHEAPPAPRDTQVWIDIEGGDDRTRSRISSIGIITNLARDARIVRVTLTDKFGSVGYYAAADDPGICAPGLSILGGPVRVSITAIDLAGNESPPEVVTAQPRVYNTRQTTVCVLPATTSRSIGLGVFRMLVLLGCAATTVAIRSRLRAATRMAATVEPFAIASVDDLARAVRDRALLTLTVVALATALATRGHSFLVATLVASPVLGWVAALSVMRLWASHRALQLIAYTDALAEVRYDHVDVIARGQHAVLRAPPSRVRLAQGRGVPRARL